MKRSAIPNLVKNQIDQSITLTYQQPKYTLLWLHGLADQPHSYLPLFAHRSSPLYHGCKIKIIQAPNRFVTVNKLQCPAWYDLKTLNRTAQPQENNIDYNHVDHSFNYINQHFQQQINFWQQQQQQEGNNKISPNHRVYIGGMSQGATMALHYALNAANVPAGVISLSGHMLKYTNALNLRKLPILLMHGLKDIWIKQIEARQSYKRLLQDQFLVEYRVMKELSQGVNLQQLQKMSEWLSASQQFIVKHYQQQAKG